MRLINYDKRNECWGLETQVNLYRCNPEIIRDAGKIKQFVIELCQMIEMKRFGECQVVHFGEDKRVAGYSMIQLIETSSISGHFANESNAAYLNVFSCKEYDPKVVEEFCFDYFEAKEVHSVVNYRE